MYLFLLYVTIFFVQKYLKHYFPLWKGEKRTYEGSYHYTSL
ncbi:hypothetical protein SAMN05421677_10679 [Halobacillus aidingensis]|uniref:Uncharacterized protein n=1 Tax=Halobacillus aidingensis TaxID=240303 RepID=A0A1H0KPT1_HALAD|nr:hypothetical protein SAMN05421677_10679 [Halobacillus aidingensis]